MYEETTKNFSESPWLTPKEAANYCKISLSHFNQKRKESTIETGGTRRRPRFHKRELDKWMRGEYRRGNKFTEDKKNAKFRPKSESRGSNVFLVDEN